MPTLLRDLIIAIAAFAVIGSAFALAACSDDDDDGDEPDVVQTSELSADDSDQPDDDQEDGDGVEQRPTFPHTTPGPEAPPPLDGEPTYTDSGLGVIEIQPGEGVASTQGSYVTVHYTGWLEDGTKFDSSRDSNQPFVVVVGTGQVIAGWDEGLLGVRPGEMRRLIIPPELAYEDVGFADVIPPGATLTFDIEVLDVQETQ